MNATRFDKDCLNNFYHSALGTGVKFGSPLSLLPGWNPEWGSNAKDWALALFGKGGGVFGSGITPGTNEIVTLTGTRVIASNPELVADALLGGLEKAAWPLAAGATIGDVLAHINCGSSDVVIDPAL
jgi:hypothetical protein